MNKPLPFRGGVGVGPETRARSITTPPQTPPLKGRGLPALAAAFALLATPAFADGIVDNVTGVTLDASGQVEHFKAVIVSPDGKVVRLVPPGEEPPKRTKKNPGPRYDWRIDMRGAVLLPGFIDAHSHMMDLGFRLLELDLSSSTSLDRAKAMIAAYAAADPDRKLILGGGWDQEKWGLGRFPTAADLDAVTGSRPAAFERIDSHAIWLNSAAMREAGITAATQPPPGGRIERDAGGNPTGIFTDAARDMVLKALPQPRAADRDLAFRKAQELMLSMGVTATWDMRTTLPEWLAFRRAGDVGALLMRIESYADSIETANLTAGKGPSPWLYDNRLKLIGVKFFADGALGSRGACLKAPYADAPKENGQCFFTDAKLKNVMSRAAMDGFQVAVHAIGDKANEEVLDAIDTLAQTYGGDRRWRIEHAQIVDPADLPRFGKNDIVASMQPIHQVSDRTMAEARLGPNRLVGAYAWNAMLANGAHLAFGSDAPNDDPNPFHGWAAGFTRQDADGTPYGGWQPQQRITREQAWAAYTSGAAYAGFAEKMLGTLQPGQLADFIIVDRDPTFASPTDLRATKVQQTWVGGKKVWERR